MLKQVQQDGFVRVWAGCTLVLVTACSKESTGQGGTAEDNHVPCALAGAQDFTPTCTREKSRVDGAEVWLIRHPDGGFRRFEIVDNGKRIATADGAWEVQAGRVGAELEVRVANDRYRFPAAAEKPSMTGNDKPR